MLTSSASAVWNGGLKGGNGTYRAETSGSFQGEYSFPTRFEGKKGSNPEELIAAAHAACYSMALSGALEKAGHAPEQISTTAHCSLDRVEGGFAIKHMRLVTRGRVPGIDAAAFQRVAEEAKNGCPVSNALKNNVAIELEAALEG